jgi:uncharacterized protein (TIGR00251 family)
MLKKRRPSMSLVIEIKVIPSARAKRWSVDKGGTLKCYLQSPPEKNKANQELQKTIAQALGISNDKVEIIHGHTSRLKRVKIHVSCTLAYLYEVFKIDWQQPILHE